MDDGAIAFSVFEIQTHGFQDEQWLAWSHLGAFVR